MGALPFEGVRVLDHSWYAAGPMATKLLANYGAEVIKIESEHRVEPLREAAPRSNGQLSRNVSLYNAFNDSKRSVTLNMKHPKGAEILRRLVIVSDVWVDNFVPDVTERWGFSPEQIHEINPGMIVVTMPWMGRGGGRYKNVMSFGPAMMAMAGFAGAMGFAGDPPVHTNNVYPDLGINSYHAAVAILAALHDRNRTCRGQFIELSQYESTVAALEVTLMRYLANGETPPRQGNRVEYAAPHGVYPCRGENRWCTIAVRTDEEWRRFCQAIGHDEWLTDPRFATLATRKQHEDELEQLVEQWTRVRTAEDVMFTLQHAGVPAGKVQDARDLLNDPHIADRGHYVYLDHPEDGRRVYDGLHEHLSETPGAVRAPAPLLGEANQYVFRDLLGLNEEEINQGYIEGLFS